MNGHFVRFYEHDQSFTEVLIGYLGNGLETGDACIVLSTRAHRNELDRRLHGRVRLRHAETNYGGLYMPHDAVDMLSRVSIDGWPDEQRFAEQIGDLVDKAGRRGSGKVRIFVEMVDLLFARGEADKALHLEEMWNRLLERYPLFVFCSYSTLTPQFEANRTRLAEICRLHTAICLPSSVSFAEIQRPRFF